MRKTYLLIGLCSALFFSCSETDPAKESKTTAPVQQVAAVTQGHIPSNVYDEAFLKSITPLQFLDTLKAHEANSFVTIVPTKGWIKASDLSGLMNLITDRTRCAGVVSKTSSSIPPGNIRSSVGVEAMMLIEGFRQSNYPAYNTSVEFGKGMQMDKKDMKLVLYPDQLLVEGEQAWYKKRK